MTDPLMLAKAALWDALPEGKRVMVLCPNEVVAGVVMARTRDLLPESFPATYRLTNGDRSITFAEGGNIRFRSVRTSLRGMTLDQVYLPEDARDEIKVDAQIAMASSRIGALTEY